MRLKIYFETEKKQAWHKGWFKTTNEEREGILLGPYGGFDGKLELCLLVDGCIELLDSKDYIDCIAVYNKLGVYEKIIYHNETYTLEYCRQDCERWLYEN